MTFVAQALKPYRDNHANRLRLITRSARVNLNKHWKSLENLFAAGHDHGKERAQNTANERLENRENARPPTGAAVDPTADTVDRLRRMHVDRWTRRPPRYRGMMGGGGSGREKTNRNVSCYPRWHLVYIRIRLSRTSCLSLDLFLYFYFIFFIFLLFLSLLLLCWINTRTLLHAHTYSRTVFALVIINGTDTHSRTHALKHDFKHYFAHKNFD